MAELDANPVVEAIRSTQQVSDTTAALLRLLIQRDQTGREKYGTTLDRTDLTSSQWLDHLTEEMLDAAGYAQALKRTLEGDPMDKLDRIVKTLESLQERMAANEGAVTSLTAMAAQLVTSKQQESVSIGYANESFREALEKLALELNLPAADLEEPMKRALQQLQFVRT